MHDGNSVDGGVAGDDADGNGDKCIDRSNFVRFLTSKHK